MKQFFRKLWYAVWQRHRLDIVAQPRWCPTCHRLNEMDAEMHLEEIERLLERYQRGNVVATQASEPKRVSLHATWKKGG